VNGPEAGERLGGSRSTFGVAALAIAAFGLVGGLPYFLGPALGVVGLGVAALVRRRSARGRTFAPMPALVALTALAVTAPAVASAELLGGVASLGLLLWMADDPRRPAGGGRRASLALASCGLTVGIAWAVLLAVPHPAGGVGVAGALLALVLLFLAYLLAREAEARGPGPATA